MSWWGTKNVSSDTAAAVTSVTTSDINTALDANPKDAAPAPSGCPVSPANRTRWSWGKPKDHGPPAGTALNPDNNMPAEAAQATAPGQVVTLEKARVKSTIPKSEGSDEVWEYPSPQMFWNAMVRKNKAQGSSELDMEMVVAIHNNMNERTWDDVLSWEALRSDQGAATGTAVAPKLVRFTGRPDENSPKSCFKQFVLGCPPPFDRHDWVVSRGDGKEVRYVIDYYHDDEGVDADSRPGLHDTESIRSIRIDVRPALDSAEAILDRVVRMPFASALHYYQKIDVVASPPLTGVEEGSRTLPLLLSSLLQVSPSGSSFQPLSLSKPRSSPAADAYSPQVRNRKRQLEAAERGKAREASMAASQAPLLQTSLASSSDAEVEAVKALGVQVGAACGPCKLRLGKCEGEEECSNAAIALTYCMGQVLCGDEAAVFGAALENPGKGGDQVALEKAYSAMTSCIEGFEVRARPKEQ